MPVRLAIWLAVKFKFLWTFIFSAFDNAHDVSPFFVSKQFYSVIINHFITAHTS